MSETKLITDTRIAHSRLDVRLFRNNVGKLEDKTGRWVTFGLCPGSSDLIGWRSVVVTPDMVGKRVAIFVALEGKMPKQYPTIEQDRFIEAVLEFGGIAGVFRSVTQAGTILKGGA